MMESKLLDKNIESQKKKDPLHLCATAADLICAHPQYCVHLPQTLAVDLAYDKQGVIVWHRLYYDCSNYCVDISIECSKDLFGAVLVG